VVVSYHHPDGVFLSFQISTLHSLVTGIPSTEAFDVLASQEALPEFRDLQANDQLPRCGRLYSLMVREPSAMLNQWGLLANGQGCAINHLEKHLGVGRGLFFATIPLSVVFMLGINPCLWTGGQCSKSVRIGCKARLWMEDHL